MEVRHLRKLKEYTPTQFMAEDSHYDKAAADYAVRFIECLAHTKGTWAGKPFELIDWQERIIRDLFGVLKPNGYRQFNTAYIEIPKKNGKSELAAAVALLLTCGDGEERAEVYGCAADRQQAAIVFDVAADMVRKGYVISGENGLLVNAPVFTEEQHQMLKEMFSETAERIAGEAEALMETVIKILKNHIPSHLKRLAKDMTYLRLFEDAISAPVSILCDRKFLLPYHGEGVLPTTYVILKA